MITPCLIQAKYEDICLTNPGERPVGEEWTGPYTVTMPSGLIAWRWVAAKRKGTMPRIVACEHKDDRS
jgi:hypothetical protein